MSVSSSAFAQDAQCLFRDLCPERGETDHSAGSFDEGDSEQVLKLPEARRQGGLRHEAGLRRLAEMAMLAKGNEILELLDRGEVDNHR
jgi:hypothetical protein